MERLQKLIAESGYCSRRKAEELIINGDVRVDGVIIKELGAKFSKEAKIEIKGKTLKLEQKEYYLLNKPREYICSLSDEKGRKIVTDLIATKARIYPVGRLDYDTTGLLILTNDGELSNILMHPSSKVEKTYIAKIEGILSSEELNNLKRGIIIDGIKCRPNHVKVRKRDKVKNNDLVEVTIEEGRNHIVKRLFKELNHEVEKLTRIRYGFLELDGLKSGDYRILTNSEVRKLYSYKKISKK
ncbi:MAG: rRNA pseudouridine synthase [Bacilli bacterium]|nr:rRNA pseudouridine synthase [Bacilli bacterium]